MRSPQEWVPPSMGVFQLEWHLEASTLQVLVHTRVPASYPRLAHVWPPSWRVSHASPGLMTPFPQLWHAVVIKAWQLAAQVSLPP